MLTCNYIIHAMCPVWGPDGGLIDSKYVAGTSEGECKLCCGW